MIEKIMVWIKVNCAGVFGIAQAVVKFVKEVLTALINILLPVIPYDQFDPIVMKVRDAVNKVDEFLENIKEKFLL